MDQFDNLREAILGELNQILLKVDTLIGDFEDADPTPEMAGQALVDLHAFKTNFAFVYERMEHVAAQVLGDIPEIDLPDGSKIEKRYGSSRKTWNHRDLASVVASRISDMSIDMDTGERLLSPQEMVVKVLDYVQPSYWRVKELNKIGINPDRFCEVSEGKTSMIVRRAQNDY